MVRKIVAALLFCFGVIVGPAHSQAVYAKQNRWVEARFNNSTKKQEAIGYGPFVVQLCNVACSEQASLLESTFVQAAGAGSGSPQTNGNWCDATSSYEVTYQVDRHTPYALSGFAKISTGYGGIAFVTLTGPNISLDFSATEFKKVVTFAEVGEMMPGQYTIIAKALGGGAKPSPSFPGWDSGEFNFVLDFGAACAPDCDASGSLTIADFVCFQSLYAIGDPLADCDADASLTIDDFICFQTAFAVGC